MTHISARLCARDVYFDLANGQFSPDESRRAIEFLDYQLSLAAQTATDLPADLGELESWMHQSVETVGAQYHDYLEARKMGGPRHYFNSKAHAIYFLKSVAPTKMVDGAWLYGVCRHWQEPRFGNLIKTYLEELGEGLPSKNHVTLYRKLLRSLGCERFDDLRDDHYVQGAIQLALAYHAERFLPEIIGFNLGYEQLPLHLLICAYELRELGIDSYYFTLHITVDNADSGHAKQAVDAIFDTMPRVGDQNEWLQRVRNGYALNYLGTGTTCVISQFDLEAEMNAIFARKGAIGQYAHSDYRRVEARTVNDWLSQPDDSSALTQAMEREGWFKRGQDPKSSRFWKLVAGEKARMFGVFSNYEQQVIYDWIANGADNGDFDKQFAPGARSRLSFEEKHALRENLASNDATRTDFDAEERALLEHLAHSQSQAQTMEKLLELISPANHHSTAGLMATRIFNDVLG